jgi:hypothetical protein
MKQKPARSRRNRVGSPMVRLSRFVATAIPLLEGRRMHLDADLQQRQVHDEATPSREPVAQRTEPDAIISPFVTHWGRIFYYDLVTGEHDGKTSNPGETTDGGLRRPSEDCVAHHSHGKYTGIVARKTPSHDDRTPSSRSPIKAAAVLLGIYIATYLCVAGEVHILGSPEAAAAASMAASPARPVDGSRRM